MDDEGSFCIALGCPHRFNEDGYSDEEDEDEEEDGNPLKCGYCRNRYCTSECKQCCHDAHLIGCKPYHRHQCNGSALAMAKDYGYCMYRLCMKRSPNLEPCPMCQLVWYCPVGECLACGLRDHYPGCIGRRRRDTAMSVFGGYTPRSSVHKLWVQMERRLVLIKKLIARCRAGEQLPGAGIGVMILAEDTLEDVVVALNTVKTDEADVFEFRSVKQLLELEPRFGLRQLWSTRLEVIDDPLAVVVGIIYATLSADGTKNELVVLARVFHLS